MEQLKDDSIHERSLNSYSLHCITCFVDDVMTKKEAAIVSAYTGFLCGSFSEMQCYAEDLLKRPIFTHEFANEQLQEELREKSKPDFVNLNIQ